MSSINIYSTSHWRSQLHSKTRKTTKGPREEEDKPSLFTNNMSPYIENPREPIERLLRFIQHILCDASVWPGVSSGYQIPSLCHIWPRIWHSEWRINDKETLPSPLTMSKGDGQLNKRIIIKSNKGENLQEEPLILCKERKSGQINLPQRTMCELELK